jgi:integrase
MLKVNATNEKLKNKYYEYLREVEWYSEKSIKKMKSAIYCWEDFSDFDDFGKFSMKKAVDFKEWFKNRIVPRTNKPLALKTRYDYLRHLRDFFKWVTGQSGYKRKINIEAVECLRLSKEESRMALAKRREHYPEIEQIKQVVKSITINNEIDMRDRAMLCFTFLSSTRDDAIISLPLGCSNENTLEVDQDPAKGVRTKYNERIQGVLFKFDDEFLGYVLDWVKYLKNEKQFCDTDPIFPASKLEHQGEIKKFVCDSVVSKFWADTSRIRAIFKQRFEEAGIEYYQPHSFRHTANKEAVDKCRNGEQLRAVSQNFGHKHIGTTLGAYAKMPADRVNNVILGMNFSSKDTSLEEDMFNNFKEYIKWRSQQGRF